MRVDRLRELQREVLAALERPLTGPSRTQAGLPERGHADPAFAALARAVVAPSASLDESARLEVYHRQYWFRLLGALADDYPALRWLLGPRAFGALCERYLVAHPPDVRPLAELGARLPAFIAGDDGVTTDRGHAEELAQLEAAWAHAFAAGVGAPVAAAALPHVSLALVPHLSLLACRGAPDVLWQRARAGRPRGRLPRVASTPRCYVAVFRDGVHRDFTRLHPAAHAILAGITAEGSLAAALERAAPRLPRRGAAARVQRWFSEWTARGWIVEKGPSR